LITLLRADTQCSPAKDSEGSAEKKGAEGSSEKIAEGARSPDKGMESASPDKPRGQSPERDHPSNVIDPQVVPKQEPHP
jgi:hypothetical protein